MRFGQKNVRSKTMNYQFLTSSISGSWQCVKALMTTFLVALETFRYVDHDSMATYLI